MPRITANNVDYHYQRRGAGPPLVLLHGFTGSSLSWSGLIETLSPRMEIISIDLLGHGQTESPRSPHRYAIKYAAQDIVTAVDQLGLDHFSLLGYSMGGRLALYLAHHYPESINALILESASPGIAGAGERQLRRQQDDALAESIERDGVRDFVDRWEQMPLFASQLAVPPQRKAVMREQRVQNSALGLANSLRGIGTGSQPSLWPSLAAMTTPTLLLCGELDEKYVRISRQMAGAMSNCELEIVGDAGHNIHFERPARFAAVVAAFLQRTT